MITPIIKAFYIETLLERIKELGDSPVPSRDFQLAINSTIGMLDLERQQRFVQIDGIAKSVLAGKGFAEYTGFKENLRNVSEEEINAVIKKFLNLDKAAIAIVRGSKS